MSKPAGRLVVVDVETSGIDPDSHVVLEVAAVDLSTMELFTFVPQPLDRGWSGDASPEAMACNRYYERRLFERQLDSAASRAAWGTLAGMLDGATLGGVNPQFDSAFIARALVSYGIERTWGYHLRDLASMACGVLGLDPARAWSSREIASLCGITNDAPHTAAGDALCEALCFKYLVERE